METAPTAADGQRQMEVPGCHLTHHTAPTHRWRSLAVTSRTRRPSQQTDGGLLLADGGPLLSPHTPDGPHSRQMEVPGCHLTHQTPPFPSPPPHPPQQTDGGPWLSPHTLDDPHSRQMEVPGCHLTHHTAPTADRWRSLAVTSHTTRSPQQTDGGPWLSPHTPHGPHSRQMEVPGCHLTHHTVPTADRWRSLAVTSHTRRPPSPPPPLPPQQTDGGPGCHLTHHTAPTADRWRSLAGRWRSLAVTSHTTRSPQQTDGGLLLSLHTPDAPPPPPPLTPSQQQKTKPDGGLLLSLHTPDSPPPLTPSQQQKTKPDGGLLLSLHTPDGPPPLTPSQQQKTKPDGGLLLSLHTPDSPPPHPPPPSPLTAADRAGWRSVAVASHTRQLKRVC